MCLNHLINNQLEWGQRELGPRGLLSPPGFPPGGRSLLGDSDPAASGRSGNPTAAVSFTFTSSAPPAHTPPPHHTRARSARSASPSGMANGQALPEPNLALAASCRRQRELVNLPIIAAFKGTAQQLGWRRERSIAAGPGLMHTSFTV